MRGRRLVFQKKLVKIKPWERFENVQSRITAPSAPIVEVKIEQPDLAVTDFEEVSIDGTEASKPENSIPVVVKPPKKRIEDVIVYMCNACKVYFPMKSSLEHHHKTVHGNVGSERVTRLKSNKEEKGPENIFYAEYHKAKNGQYVCNYCPFMSFVQSNVVTHAVRKHGTVLQLQPDNTIQIGVGQKIEETLIEDTIVDVDPLPKTEISDEDDEDSWPIDVVEEEFHEEVQKIDEEAEKSTEKVRSCPYCSFETTKSSTFHSHVKRKHYENWAKSIEEKVTTLANTRNVYTAEKQCRYCNYRTFNRSTLHSHVIRKHPQHKGETEDSFVEIKEEDLTDLVQDRSTEAGAMSLCKEEVPDQNRKAMKCPYCPFESWILSTMQSHITRRHRGMPTAKKQPSAQLYTGYACHFCTFVAATVASFHAHTNREHSGQKQPIKEVPVTEYDCDQCDFKSRNRRNMQLHVKQCHTTQANEEGMFACHACSYETMSRMGLQRHVSIKHNKPRREAMAKAKNVFYSCEECEFKCMNKKMMDWHKRQHSAPPNAEDNGNTYFCNDCDFSTWTKGQLYLHIRRKHKDSDGKDKELEPETETIFACDQCDYTSKNKHVMKVHVIRKHTNDYNHECEICGKKYKVKADLTNHIRFQHREQPIICDVCGKTCRNSNLLYLHQKFAHYKPEFECPICHRRMVSQANLDDHIIKQHEQREDVVCEECGKTFTKQARLKIHMRIHTGVKPYTCKVCLKAFARRNGLRQHLLIHTGQRPYICDICGKSFTQKTGLISHRKSHPGSHPPLPRVTIDHVLSDLLNEES